MGEAATKAMAAHPSNMQIKRGAKRLLEVLSQPLPEEARWQQAPTRPGRQRPVSSSSSVSFSTCAEKSRKNHHDVKLHEWLMELDSVGFLMEYYCDLKQKFSSLSQVMEVYA